MPSVAQLVPVMPEVSGMIHKLGYVLPHKLDLIRKTNVDNCKFKFCYVHYDIA